MGRAARRAAIGVAVLRAAGSRAAGPRRRTAATDDPPRARPRERRSRRRARRATADAARGRGGSTADSRAATAPGPAARGRRRRAAAAGGPDGPGTGPGGRPAAGDVPRWLRVSAGWAWRLLLLAALLYVAGGSPRCSTSSSCRSPPRILLTALLQPLTARLRRARARPAVRDLVHPAARVRPDRRRGVAGDRPGRGRVPGAGHPGGAHEHPDPVLAGRPRRSTSGPGTWRRSPTTWSTTSASTARTVEGAALTGGRIVVELLAGIVLVLLHLVLPDQGRRADLVLADQRAVAGAQAARRPGGPRRLAGRRLLRQGHRRGGRDPRRRHGDHAHDHRLAAGRAAGAVHVRRRVRPARRRADRGHRSPSSSCSRPRG